MVDAATGWFMPSLGYTTNGATPTSTAGTLIASGGSAIVPAGGATLKAMAFKSGATNSAVASGVFSVAAAVATPTFNPVAGAYPASQYPKSVVVTSTTGASIRYTTNGTTPTSAAGTLIASGGTAVVPGGATLKAIAFKSGWSNSAVASGVFLIAVEPVVFSDPGDVYPSTKYVTMTSATSGATIFYTSSTSGYPSAPTHSGATETGSTFKYTGPASVKPGTYKYFKAVGYKSGMADSVVTSGFAENTNPGSPLSPAQEPAAAPSEAAAVAAATPPPRRTVTYTLDALNRKSMTDNGVVTNYTYTGNDLNQFTTVGTQSPAYDANFQLSSYAGWSYVYDADGRLASATASGQSAQFVYDGLGRCVKRTINGAVTLFTYDGWKPIVEWDSAGALVASNIYGPGADEILWRYQVGIGQLHYHLDRLGNVQFLLSSTNAGLEKYTYDAFGQPRITDWSGNVRTASAYGNRFMFTGREWLSTLGLYDYRHRAYHPGLGRFLQTDPLGFGGGDANLYRYVGNNPANLTDPRGTDAIPVKGGYGYRAYGGPDYVGRLLGGHVVEGSKWKECAGAARYLGGGYGADGNYHNMPGVEYWSQGASLSRSTPPGTIVVTGWENGGYPSRTAADYGRNYTGIINHTAVVAGFDSNGNAIVYSQSKDRNLVQGTVPASQFSQWNQVFVAQGNGPYESAPSGRAVIVGRDPNTGETIYAGRPVFATPHASAGGYTWGTNGTGWGGGGQGTGWGAFGGVGGGGLPGPGSITGSLIGDGDAHNSG